MVAAVQGRHHGLEDLSGLTLKFEVSYGLTGHRIAKA